MATKTITIDLDAYDRLNGMRQEHESFSEAIKRLIRPKPDIDALCERLAARPMSRRAVAAIEQQVQHRHRASSRKR